MTDHDDQRSTSRRSILGGTIGAGALGVLGTAAAGLSSAGTVARDDDAPATGGCGGVVVIGRAVGQRTSCPGCGSVGMVPSRPAWKSSNACTSSSRVFMTNGP